MTVTAPAVSAPDRRAGLLWALVAALAFSTLGIWGKLATASGLDSFAALTFRFGLVALVLLPFTSRGLTWAARGRMLGVGLVYALATTCFFGALARVSAGTTGLLLYLAPAFVVLFGWLLLGRTPGRRQLGAVALAAAGLGLVVGLPAPTDRDPLGLLLGAGAGALYAAYLMASERWLADTPALSNTAHVALSAALYFGALAVLGQGLQVPTGAQWLPVLGLALIPTLIAVPALYGAVRHLGAAQASLLGTLEPLFTVALAFLVLHEPLRPAALLGGALILGGAALSQRR